MKQLIVNADDFGYTRGVNRAVVEAYRNGIVTSTSLMANGDAFEDAVALARVVGDAIGGRKATERLSVPIQSAVQQCCPVWRETFVPDGGDDVSRKEIGAPERPVGDGVPDEFGIRASLNRQGRKLSNATLFTAAS